ncbi:Chaperone protein dnaJ 49 [Cardamine amara subsp. amara]|uniref:Chaperone protein dnaJ 49 n=1 Tax=Cardamine amara subsp. amara TaxID=228776 RepID=A0ABD1ACY7_CARAN
MEAYREEALKAKMIAERRFAEKDFTGARSYALRAKSLFPDLEGLSQMVTTYDVYIASQGRRSGEIDYYAVLGLKPSAGKREVKKQFKKMAVLLHPDKNKCLGANGAFQIISEAWNFLSNEFKKSTFYYKRKKLIDSMVVQKNTTEYAPGTAGFDCCPPPVSERVDTFWTVCTSCKVQYEYLRKYVNKRLSCKNCRGAFIAVETGPAPVSASIQYAPPSHTPSNGYGAHGYDAVSRVPTNSTYFLGQYPAHGYEYVTNESYDWSSYVGTSPANHESNHMSSVSNGYPYKLTNGVVCKGRKKVKEGSNRTSSMKGTPSELIYPSPPNWSADPSVIKACRPEKKRNLGLGSSGNGFVENITKSNPESKTTTLDANMEHEFKHPGQSYGSMRRWSSATGLDTRKLLINKAKTHIQQRLEMMRLASVAAAATEDVTPLDEINASSKEGDGVTRIGSSVSSGHQSVRKINGPITVPDSDFHDFDKNRSEECFEARQIWAIYDEDDGMPRLYCMVREVLSVQPFKIDIAYLSSKTDIEFGTMKWVQYGFTKSCGHFRIRNTDIVDHVNIFSHLLKGRKTGRGGCVRIFPKTGDIWAVYKNWSPDWNNSTPDEVRHQYEMVEILDEYSEQFGVSIAPLVKVEGYKTVYTRKDKEESTKWIPRKEMLRFSHQVPSWFLKEETIGVPGNCWDLDPAAIPEELLHTGEGTDCKRQE